MKSGESITEYHDLHTHLNLKRVLAGNLAKISLHNSGGKEGIFRDDDGLFIGLIEELY